MFKRVAWVQSFQIARLGLLVAAGAWCGISAPCLAQQPGQFDVQRSRIFVRVGATGLGHAHGVEGRLKSGRLALSGGANAGELAFDMTTFAADTAASRAYVGLSGETDASTAGKVTANMLGGEVLDVGKYPVAIYRVHSSVALPKRQANDPQAYQLDGEFILHGVTRPLRIIAAAEVVGGLVHLRGQFSVRQTQFGITPYSTAFGAVGVADELKIWGDLWLKVQ